MIKKDSQISAARDLPVLIISFLALVFCAVLPLSLNPQSTPSPNLLPGQSATVLSDGKWLLVGGESLGSSLSNASIWDPRTGATTALTARLQQARAWHTATVLPDGAVFILGGVSSNGQVLTSPELFDPETQSFEPLPATCCLTPRSRHTATLLTDSNLLIAGGMGANKVTLSSAELWDYVDDSVTRLADLNTARRSHSASLMSDGTVLIQGGADRDGDPLSDGDHFDPATQKFTSLDAATLNAITPSPSPILVDSLPSNNAVDVPTDSILAFRFSKPLRSETVNGDTLTLSGPKGIEKIKVVPAEAGMLAFATPEAGLLPGTTYTVTINGPADKDGVLLPVSGISFSTEPLPSDGQPAGDPSNGSGPQPTGQPPPSGSGLDDGWTWTGQLKDGKPHSPWQDLAPLEAEAGVTALAGQVLDLKGDPLAKVTLKIEGTYGGEGTTVQTDETGRFLLTNINVGWHELIIDGRLARRRLNAQSAALAPQEDHGVFEYGLEIKEGQTTTLPFTIWLPKIDKNHAVQIPSPTTSEVVLTSPRIPGLEVHIPPNTVIYDHERQVVREVSLTPIPLDRTPFPLPTNVKVPIYFTAQPGGAYIANSEHVGARIHYPNTFNELPGTRFKFWHYDPGYKGWYVYGLGIVPESGKQVIPDPGISVREFTGAMVGGPGWAPPSGPPPCPAGVQCDGGDPVNLATGLFVLRKTDLSVPDGIMPINLTRTYRPGDTRSRGFGIGASHSYDFFIVGDKNPYTYIDLILPDGGRVHYSRISEGTSFGDAVYEHSSTQTRFYKSRISWNGGWDLKFPDGTLYKFPDGEIAEINSTSASALGAYSITDRNGNVTSIVRVGNGNISRIIAPGSRWIEFTYSSSDRITQAKDNSGRTVNYEYDTTGRLIRVTDPNGGVTEYTYDALSRMTTIKDARNIVYLTNEYDSTDKVIKQTLVDGGIYLFNYTMNGSSITRTDVTDPRLSVRRVTFNSTGQILTDTRALEKPEEQITTYNLEAGTNFRLSQVDPLGRTTAYTYDAVGNVTSITRLSGTPDAVTTSYTYEPAFNQRKTVTDPLNHTTTFNYDIEGNLIGVTDPLGHTTTMANNPTGQPISITDPLGHTTKFAYDLGDVVAITDPLGNVTTRTVDSAGRILLQTNPLGNTTLYDYDALNRLTKVTDPLSGATQFGYDANGNLLSVTDAQNHATGYSYDNMDRLSIRTDPLSKAETSVYDNNGNLTQFTDRKGQSTTYVYDALNRRTQITYADTSTTTYAHDTGNRLTQINDSVSGLITRTYDGLDRLTFESTPQGSITYTYNAAGRRATMTVSGQSSVVYSYDNANRLLQITQGSSVVSYTYDNVGRRTSLTLLNGILAEYTYDAASRVTSIIYKQSGITVLGDLTYEYDKAGNRTKIGGSFARTGIPQAVSSTAYNAANHQTTFGDKTLTYDNNGNLLTVTGASGTTIYTWSARNQLTGITGPGVNATFVYDGFGRREKKTITENLTEFLFDRGNPVQETSGSTVLANLLTGLRTDEYFTRADVPSATTSHFLADALGSTIALADAAGTMQTEYTYEPFGRTTVTGLTSNNSSQFTSRENDGTGLYYYRARYYDVGLDRFISEDPKYSPYHSSYDPPTTYNPSVSNYMERDPNVPLFGMRGSCPSMYVDSRLLHLYAYANGNPTNLIDLEGLTAGSQSPGCDRIPETECMTGCCNEHDQCFTRAYFSFCDETTWLEQFFGSGYRTRLECQRCNRRVMKCVLCCLNPMRGRKDNC